MTEIFYVFRFSVVMALLDPASISLGEEEEEEEEEQILDATCIPSVGASVVIDDQAGQSTSIKDDHIAVFSIFAKNSINFVRLFEFNE